MLNLPSPAKINWFLRVISKREDGYHNIYSLVQPVKLHDSLQFEKTDKNIKIETSPDIPIRENLVYKAAILLKELTGCSAGARIKLIKRIPLQAGLGGGSSNAATALMGLNVIWETNLSIDVMSTIAAKIGSDVPFFLYRRVAVVEGRGEIIRPINIQPGPVTLLIVKPGFGVPAVLAYNNVMEFHDKDEKIESRMKEILEGGLLNELSDFMINDLEEPIFKIYPSLKEIKTEMLKNGAIASLLSGSGSSVFGVFSDRNKAIETSKHFQDMWHLVTETL